jgi:hypothetical protein
MQLNDHSPRAALRAAALVLAAAPAAAQFSAISPLPGDLALAPSAGNQRKPHIAAGAGHFLAVWEDDASSLVDTVLGQQAAGSSWPGNSDVHGMLLDANGVRLFDAPLVIAHEPWDQLRPRAAWNGSEYLVVFEATRPTSAFYSKGVYGVRVSAAGQVLDATPFVIYDSPGFDERLPVVASLGGTWLVAWLDLDPITQYATVSGRVVTGPGVLAPKRTLIAGVAFSVPSELDVAAAAGRYAVVYSVNYGSGIRARLFDAAASPTTSVLTLGSSTGHRVGIAPGAAGFYVAWLSGAQFRGTTLDPNGGIGTSEGAVIVPGGFDENSYTQVAFDGATYTVAFDANPNVYAVRVDAGGVVVGGPTIVATTPRWLDDIAVAGASGLTHVLWTDVRATPNNFGTDQNDVWYARLNASGGASSSAPLSVSPPAQFGARIAGDASGGFLMVFHSWSAGVSRILAQRVDADGRALAAEPFEVVSADRTLLSPDIAWNGAEFLVTWARLRSLALGGTPPLIEARRCRVDGTFLDAAPVAVMEGNTTAVDAVGRTFMVTGHYHHAVFQSNHVVRFRRMDGATGAFLDAAPVIVVYAEHHDVVALADRWFVMWRGINLMAGAPVDLNGTVGPATTYGLGHAFRLARNPARTEILVVYEWYDQSHLHTSKQIRMQRIAPDGAPFDPQLGLFVSSAPNAQLRPAGVSLGDEYTVVWADHRAHPIIEPGLGDVYACRLDSDAVQLDPQGIPLLATPNAEGSVELFASGPGHAIFAASALERTGPRAGVHRIRTGGYRGVTLGNVSCTQPAPNSTGAAGVLAVYGSSRALDRNLELTATQLPLHALAFFLVSRTQGSVVPPGSQGVLCVAGQVGRYVGPGQVRNSGPSGAIALVVDPGVTPTPFGSVAILAGETWTYQAWHRDAVQGVATSNFTSAVAVTFR